MTTIIDITLSDGRVISGEADFGKGSPADPMTYDEVAGKFLECAEYAGLAKDDAGRVVDMVRTLESVGDVGALTALVSG